VGFPGETEEDFAQTAALFAEADYDMAYVFKYSVRTGTPAAELGDQVDEATKERRNQELLRLLEGNSRRHTAALVGTVQEVLVEGPDKRGRQFTGRTRGNRLVHFPSAEQLVGALAALRITRATTSVLYGELEPTVG
jgi:tRNA-2-methylthio-N6-dimethylallyladenosine synthase